MCKWQQAKAAMTSAASEKSGVAKSVPGTSVSVPLARAYGCFSKDLRIACAFN